MGMLNQWWKDLRETLTPAGMAQFFASHRYTLAMCGAFTAVGLVLFVGVDVAKYKSALFKLVQDYEVRTLDARFLVRGPRPVDPRIAIIGIDQKTLNDVGF